jgi:hypothetical protein
MNNEDIEKAIEKARRVVEEIYQRALKNRTSRPQYSVYSVEVNDLETITRNREQAIKASISYIRHVETLTLKVEKPTVIKKPHFGYWAHEKNRLHVCPVVRFKSAIGEGRITHEDGFEIRTSEVQGEDFGKRFLPSAGFNGLAGGLYTHHIPSELHPLILELCTEKLDALDQKLREVDADTIARLDEILAAHKGKHSKKESKKFQEKLMKFMKAFPFFADSKAEFVMDCFQIEYEDLEGLQKFLKMNRADINFITVEDIEEARQLAQIAEVHDG